MQNTLNCYIIALWMHIVLITILIVSIHIHVMISIVSFNMVTIATIVIVLLLEMCLLDLHGLSVSLHVVQTIKIK